MDHAQEGDLIAVIGKGHETYRDREGVKTPFLERELLDKKLWQIPDRIRDRAAFEENINRALREHHPEYWRSRQQGLERERARSGPSRGAER